MRRAHGYAVWSNTVTGNTDQERDTVQCKHCQMHIFVKPGTVSTVYLIPDPIHLGVYHEEPGAWCSVCHGPVCLRCHEIGTCNPAEKQLVIAELETAMRDIRARLGWSPKGASQ